MPQVLDPIAAKYGGVPVDAAPSDVDPIAAKYGGVPVESEAPASDVEETPSGPMRALYAFGRTIDPRPLVKGAAHLLTTDPLQLQREAGEAISGGYQQFKEARARDTSATQGMSRQEIASRARGPSESPADPWEVAGTGAGLMLPGAALKGAKVLSGAMKARAVTRLPGQIVKEFEAAFPATPGTPYKPEQVLRAKPRLDIQHQKMPITSAGGTIAAVDRSLGEMEQVVRNAVERFPTDQVHANVSGTLRQAFANDPDQSFLGNAVKEVERFRMDDSKTIAEADALRRRLNAENNAVLKRNNYDQALARQNDPGFAARELAADQYRDAVYGFLEQRGIPGIRELRLEEGDLMQLRRAMGRQEFAGGKELKDMPASLGRRALAGAASAVPPAIGAGAGAFFGGPTGAVIGGGAGVPLGINWAKSIGAPMTRDQVVTRLFNRPNPVQAAGPQPRVAGLLGPAARQMPSSMAPVGGIEAPMPAGYPGYPTSTRLALPPARQIDLPSSMDPIGQVEGQLPQNFTQAQDRLRQQFGRTATPTSGPIAQVPGPYQEWLRQAILDALKGMPE